MLKKYMLMSVVSLVSLNGSICANQESKLKQEWEQKIKERNIKNVVVHVWEGGHQMQPSYEAYVHDQEYFMADRPHDSSLCRAAVYVAIFDRMKRLSEQPEGKDFMECYKKPLAEWSNDLIRKSTKLGLLTDLNAYENNALRTTLPNESLDIVEHILKNGNIKRSKL